MKLEPQVTSLELSQKLKQLGVKQESAWYWYYLEVRGMGKVVHSMPKLVDKQYRDEAVKGEYEWDSAFVSAFTENELEKKLPKELSLKGKRGRLMYDHGDGTVDQNTYVQYKDENGLCLFFTGHVLTVDAQAKMLIYLLEHALLTL